MGTTGQDADQFWGRSAWGEKASLWGSFQDDL